MWIWPESEKAVEYEVDCVPIVEGAFGTVSKMW